MHKSVCLNMIVKNESKVIRRCLESVIPLLDHWVVVDTGSTDGTQQIILECLKELPGTLYERPWVDFSHNRNEAMALAFGKTDYLLFIDADDTLVLFQNFSRPVLERQNYWIAYHRNRCTTHRIFLIDQTFFWKWEGIIHEFLDSPETKTTGVFPQAYIEAGLDGFRSQMPDKAKRDVQLLKKSLQKDPENSRTVFHLGVFCEEAQDFLSALSYFEKRSLLGGWEQEIFYALFRIAAIQELLKRSPDLFISGYLSAYLYRPSRAEPLFYLAQYYRSVQKQQEAYLLLKTAMAIPLSKDSIYVASNIYEFDALFYFADVAYQLGKYDDTFEAYNQLLSKEKLPSCKKLLIQKNRPHVILKVSQMRGSHF
jgi:glycosyltransferase involved in cell wall biosynthesis